jgi:hypothetical protein
MDGRYRGIEESLAKFELGIALDERIDLLVRLGEYITKSDEKLDACVHLSYLENKWFIEENIRLALDAIVKAFLDKDKLNQWVEQYDIPAFTRNPKIVGIVMAGNIPLVGFHDALCVFVSGHHSLIKLSDKDKRLLPYLIEVMKQLDKRVANYFTFSDNLKGMEAVIATGSNNSARYFEAYFSKYPHIIRKNRNAIAVLDGTETEEELIALGRDIFEYFGLGCRNVSKIYIPKGYELTKLLEVLHESYKEIILHDKFKNNFDYNYALYALNRVPFLATGSLLVTEDKSLQSRIAMLHYEFYEDKKELEQQLLTQLDDIQCIATWLQFEQLKTVPLGATQRPTLTDYPDGVDVMQFLQSL